MSGGIGEQVRVDVDTVGPYHNPAERFRFYSMPVCKPPSDTTSVAASFTDTLSGTVRQPALYDLRFRGKQAQGALGMEGVCR